MAHHADNELMGPWCSAMPTGAEIVHSGVARGVSLADVGW
jgi:hypothetical protein